MGVWSPSCICGNKCKAFHWCYCCPWCCEKCKSGEGCDGCMAHYLTRKARPWTYKCSNPICDKQCAGKEYSCQCTCCRAKCKEPNTCKAPPPPAPHPVPASPGAEPQSASQELSPRNEAQTQDRNSQSASTTSPPNPQVIAAVIVAIIVAIILLDLCIFRFPVGRNIRDFLVRKIPFCIAFYS